jgi:hypothetical protein
VATSSGRVPAGRRILLFLYSTPNLVGCLLGLGGLALYALGIIGPYAPLIVVGLYLIGVLLAPRPRIRAFAAAAEDADLRRELDRRVAAHRQAVVSAVEGWWGKYRVTLRAIEGERDAAKGRLDGFLRELGYVG